jgi:hypothetical protein
VLSTKKCLCIHSVSVNTNTNTHVLQQGELCDDARDAARELVVAGVQLGQLLQCGQGLGCLAPQVVPGNGQLLEVSEDGQLVRVGLAEDPLDLVVAEVQAAARRAQGKAGDGHKQNRTKDSNGASGDGGGCLRATSASLPTSRALALSP